MPVVKVHSRNGCRQDVSMSQASLPADTCHSKDITGHDRVTVSQCAPQIWNCSSWVEFSLQTAAGEAIFSHRINRDNSWDCLDCLSRCPGLQDMVEVRPHCLELFLSCCNLVQSADPSSQVQAQKGLSTPQLPEWVWNSCKGYLGWPESGFVSCPVYHSAHLLMSGPSFQALLSLPIGFHAPLPSNFFSMHKTPSQWWRNLFPAYDWCGYCCCLAARRFPVRIPVQSGSFCLQLACSPFVCVGFSLDASSHSPNVSVSCLSLYLGLYRRPVQDVPRLSPNVR